MKNYILTLFIFGIFIIVPQKMFSQTERDTIWQNIHKYQSYQEKFDSILWLIKVKNPKNYQLIDSAKKYVADNKRFYQMSIDIQIEADTILTLFMEGEQIMKEYDSIQILAVKLPGTYQVQEEYRKILVKKHHDNQKIMDRIAKREKEVLVEIEALSILCDQELLLLKKMMKNTPKKNMKFFSKQK